MPPDQALKMYDLATDALPDNPFTSLQKAELLTTLGQQKAALKLLQELKQLKWASLYYSQAPQYIETLIMNLKAAENTGGKAEVEAEFNPDNEDK